MVGNSSAGVIEAPTLGLPAVNIGQRQRGREHADNIIFTGYELDEIAVALQRATLDPEFRATAALMRSPYGDGKTSRRIADILARTSLDARLLHKNFIMDTQNV
jgi:UDP-N-acetylglucosamine 2-epimerase